MSDRKEHFYKMMYEATRDPRDNLPPTDEIWVWPDGRWQPRQPVAIAMTPAPVLYVPADRDVEIRQALSVRVKALNGRGGLGYDAHEILRDVLAYLEPRP